MGAKYRAEARLEDHHFEERTTDMTVGEALEQIILSMQSDSFWIDLAKPVEAAKIKLAEDKKDSRAVGLQLIKDAITQIDNTQMYFKMEKVILEKILTLYEDTGTSLDTVLKGTRTTMSPDDQARLQMTAEQKEKLKKHQKVLSNNMPKPPKPSTAGPWEFVEREDKIEVTVTIPVPGATKAADVTVKFSSNKLFVAVRGHGSQPHIIDGYLAGPVDTDACGWSLDGAGDKRSL